MKSFPILFSHLFHHFPSFAIIKPKRQTGQDLSPLLLVFPFCFSAFIGLCPESGRAFLLLIFRIKLGKLRLYLRHIFVQACILQLLERFVKIFVIVLEAPVNRIHIFGICRR